MTHGSSRQISAESNHTLSGNAAGLSPEIRSLIQRLPEACQAELMKGFTGDLLQLSVKLQEIQATNVEFREHLTDIVNLLNTAKQSGNRGYARTTTRGPGGETTVEIGTGGSPIMRPVGGGCAVVLAVAAAGGSVIAWLAFA
jgi:hypothetical protein